MRKSVRHLASCMAAIATAVHVGCVTQTDAPADRAPNTAASAQSAGEKAQRPATSNPAKAGAAKPASQPAGKVTQIAITDFFPLQQSGKVLIYDVRPAFYHTLGNIPGSVNWPKSAFNNQLAIREAEIRAATAAGRPCVIYCTDLACPDARDVATWLAARGHSVRVLEGGWEAWKAIGFAEN